MVRRRCKCLNLRTATTVTGFLSTLYSVSSVSAALRGLMYGSTDYLETYLLINGFVSLLASISCLHGVSKESCYYLIPWIFVAAVSIIFGSVLALSYIAFGESYYITLGIVCLVLSVVFFFGWICVLGYFYELCEKASTSNDRDVISNISSGVIVPDYPPPYTVAYENPAFTDKPPNYEELFNNANNTNSIEESDRTNNNNNSRV